MNAVGLVAAAGAGAAQPLMGLIFGRLSQDFVVFLATVNASKSTDPSIRDQAMAALPELTDSFRGASALNASYLTYMGEWGLAPIDSPNK
jgi:ATP-binding cassette, subfamily B (MDR/TAP), member 1